MMLALAALDFLGLGIQPPDSSWGLMLAQGREYITTAWWLVTFPGLAIMLDGAQLQRAGQLGARDHRPGQLVALGRRGAARTAA